MIRPWRHEEAERLLDILRRVEVVKWLGDGPPQPMTDLDEAHARIERYVVRRASRCFAMTAEQWAQASKSA